MEVAAKVLTVMGLAAIELWVAIPAGFAFNLDPATTALAAATGATLGAGMVAFLGERVRNGLMRTFSSKPLDEKPSRIRSIWNQYGTVGLGLTAPLLTGAPLGIAIGLSLGAPSRGLFIWTTIGVVLWTMVLTIVGALGVASVS